MGPSASRWLRLVIAPAGTHKAQQEKDSERENGYQDWSCRHPARTSDQASGQEDIFATVEQAIANGQATFKLEDAKGHSYLIRTDRVVYVEQGSTTARSVGFMR